MLYLLVKVLWLLWGRITGNLTSNRSEAFLRWLPTRSIPCESRKGSSLCREDCFGLNFVSAGAANLCSSNLTCEDFNNSSSSGKVLHWMDLMMTVSASWRSCTWSMAFLLLTLGSAKACSCTLWRYRRLKAMALLARNQSKKYSKRSVIYGSFFVYLVGKAVTFLTSGLHGSTWPGSGKTFSLKGHSFSFWHKNAGPVDHFKVMRAFGLRLREVSSARFSLVSTYFRWSTEVESWMSWTRLATKTWNLRLSLAM